MPISGTHFAVVQRLAMRSTALNDFVEGLANLSAEPVATSVALGLWSVWTSLILSA